MNDPAELKTFHSILFQDSRKLSGIKKESIDLVVTSPPYPMIKMWDELFAGLSPKIAKALKTGRGQTAFDLMHQELDKTWEALARVVKPSGFVCINIGDATRTLKDNFALYSNHSRITTVMTSLGFQALPIILWKKPTNSPNKFMGSGMLPAGAYVTLEHEYILIFRKGGKRQFSTIEEKQTRNESAIFWEERNNWFSDSWALPPVRQSITATGMRDRNAAYPFDLVHRLISMYSVKGDTVLDPFLGSGTTTIAAAAAERNSIGLEIEKNLAELIQKNLNTCVQLSQEVIQSRLDNHQEFIRTRIETGKEIKYQNIHYDFPVVTRQERQIKFHPAVKINAGETNCIQVEYSPDIRKISMPVQPLTATKSQKKRSGQMSLF